MHSQFYNSKGFKKAEILVITSLLAFCSIVYELLLSNTLSIVTGNYIWWQSLTIGVYIGGLGLGAYFSDKLKNSYESIVRTEIGLSFLGALSVVFIYIVHGGYKYIDSLFFYTGEFHSAIYLQNLFILKLIFFIIVQLFTMAIGLLSGFEIPLMVRIAEEHLGETNNVDYQVFGINYIGTLLGTTCFAYFLLPKLDVIMTSIFVAGLNLLICLYFILRYLKNNKSIYLTLTVMVLALGAIVGMSEKKVTQTYLKIFYYMPRILSEEKQNLENLYQKISQFPDVERSKSLYQYLDIFKYPQLVDGEIKESLILALDTNFQFNTATEHLYHQAFAHVSIAMNKSVPRKVLLLGGGDGLLLRELLKYEAIESIDFIELDGKMLDLARGRFAAQNKNSLSHPKVKTQINDGFYYLRNTNVKYDAIFIDFPYPNSYDLARLYSVEFYTYVEKALNPNGFVVLDVPFHDRESNPDHSRGRIAVTTIFNERHIKSNSIIASTFYYAGFKTIFPYRIADESFIFLKNEPGGIDYNFMDSADLSRLDKDTIIEMNNIKNQEFPYEISEGNINSIFKPAVIKRNEF